MLRSVSLYLSRRRRAAKQRVESASDDHRSAIDGRTETSRTKAAPPARANTGPVAPTVRCASRPVRSLAHRAANDLVLRLELKAAQWNGRPRLGLRLRRDHGTEAPFPRHAKDLRIVIASVGGECRRETSRELADLLELVTDNVTFVDIAGGDNNADDERRRDCRPPYVACNSVGRVHDDPMSQASRLDPSR
jgi:hypothetical protein